MRYQQELNQEQKDRLFYITNLRGKECRCGLPRRLTMGEKKFYSIHEMMRCEKYACTMPIRDCVARQQVNGAIGAANRAGIHDPGCRDCAQGREMVKKHQDLKKKGSPMRTVQKKTRKKISEADRQRYKTELLSEISRHVGASRIIGMGALYFRVFGKNWNNRINDTRALRALITECRREGVPIVSVSSHSGGGYYLASAGSELNAYCRRIRSQALKKLVQESRLRNMNMTELLGQIQLELGGDPGGVA